MNEKRGTSFKFINSKKGQVTIFIILGVIIVGAAALIYALYPQIKSAFLGVSDPQSYIQSCVQDEIKNTISNLSLQGGSMSPQNYFPYYNDFSLLNNGLNRAGLYHVEYLCYNNQYYLPCIMQEPLLEQHVESEIVKNIQTTADSCFSSLQKNYESKGYSTNLVKGTTIVDLLPGRVVVTFNNQLTLTKDTSQRYQQFQVLVNSNLYDFITIATSILNWEASFGDAPTQSYMIYYHNLIIQKEQVGAENDPNAGGRNTDGTKVYILTDLNTGTVFQFATRGFVMPPGF
jgi:hypothetical protein